jgi:hypothetical protein
VTVDLSASPGKLTVEWFNPSQGTSAQHDEVEGATIQGGAKRTFKTPFAGDAVLYLVRTATSKGGN